MEEVSFYLFNRIVSHTQWSVGTILMGLQSFMYESTPTHGSIVTTDALKRQSASESLAYNCKNKYVIHLTLDICTLTIEANTPTADSVNSVNLSLVYCIVAYCHL